MRYRTLGRSGLFVSELCLGTMTFGGEEGQMWGEIGRLQQDEADQIVRTALDGGINFIDTANIYGFGNSERILGQSLKNLGVNREDVVIATKAMGPMGEGPNARGTSRRHLMDQIRQSLERLQLDHVDLYQIHGFDPATPIEETLKALDTIVEHGHARYIGLSNWAAWQIMKGLGLARTRNLHIPISVQAFYTLVNRDLEREIVPLLTSENLGLMVWSPLAGGMLSGKYDIEGGGGGRRDTFDFPPVNRDRLAAALKVMRPMADEKGASPAQIAIAWLLHQQVVTSVIVGAKRVDQLQDNIAATSVQLSAEDIARLNEVTELPVEYPGFMLEMQARPPE